MSRAFILLASVAIVTATGGCRTGQPVVPGGTISLCSRADATVGHLAGVLGHVDQCTGTGRIQCFNGGSWGATETREVAGATHSDWIDLAGQQNFSVADQDALLATARARAASLTPPGKSMRGLTFSVKFYGNHPRGSLGFNATYQKCIPHGPPPYG